MITIKFDDTRLSKLRTDAERLDLIQTMIAEGVFDLRHAAISGVTVELVTASTATRKEAA